MIGSATESPNPHHREREHRDPRDRAPRTPTNILKSAKFEAGPKVFFLDLIENTRGRVIRITEDVNGRRDRIMVPAEARADLIKALDSLEW